MLFVLFAIPRVGDLRQIPVMKNRPKPPVMTDDIRVRLLADDKDRIRDRADAVGVSMAEFIRRRALSPECQQLATQIRLELAQGTPEIALARILREVADELSADPVRVRIVGYEN
ncbi:plasmid mobilization protein [Devosia sp.]|uniref:plasmid mobilization protein n=1 Tax=Devosia sp. TaxID=1871048 RepID=UPI003265033F